MVEPTACAVHAAPPGRRPAAVAVHRRRARSACSPSPPCGDSRPATEILATAKHPEQRRWAKELGADAVVAPGELARAVRSATGVDGRSAASSPAASTAVVDCVGSEATLAQALPVVAPGGTVLVVGMPGRTTLDLTGLWHREIDLRGCYAYDADRADFEPTGAVDLASARTRRPRAGCVDRADRIPLVRA